MHDEAEAERLLKRGKGRVGIAEGEAWARRAGVKNAWVAERLAMRHEFHVTRAVKRVREEKQLAGLYLEL